MNLLNDARIRELIDQLDSAVPAKGAVLDYDYDGYMTANKVGYLRFGIEMLRTAYAPGKKCEGSTTLSVIESRVEPIVRATNRWPLGDFFRSESEEDFGSATGQQAHHNKVVHIILIIIAIAILAFAVIGVISLFA